MTVLPGNLCFCLVMSEAGNKEPTAFREKKTLLFSATLWMVECYVTKQAASVPPPSGGMLRVASVSPVPGL